MIPVANAIVDKCTMVVEALDTPLASHAMDRRRRPEAPAEEAEVVEVPFFSDCLLQCFIKVVHRYTFRIAGIQTEDEEVNEKGETKESPWTWRQDDPGLLVLPSFFIRFMMCYEFSDREVVE